MLIPASVTKLTIASLVKLTNHHFVTLQPVKQTVEVIPSRADEKFPEFCFRRHNFAVVAPSIVEIYSRVPGSLSVGSVRIH